MECEAKGGFWLIGKNIALCTNDMRYMKAFSDYCMRYHSDNISMDIIPFQDEVTAYIRNNHVDIFMTDSAYTAEKVRTCGIMTVILSDEKYVKAEDGRFIYRFQKMDDIMRQVYGFLADGSDSGHNGVKCTAFKNVDITGVFSPCYDAQREQFSRMLAKVYSEQYKVLYLNLSVFSEYDNGDEDGISELMYFINEDIPSASLRVLNVVKELNGYHVVPGAKHYRDLYDMTAGDMGALFSCIRAMDEFGRVIVDIGFLSDAVYAALDGCQRLYMPVMDAGSARLSHMWRDLCAEEHGALKENTKVIELPKWWDARADMRYEWVSHGRY